MDAAGGGLILPGALVVAGVGSLVGAITFLFSKLLASLKEQTTDLKAEMTHLKNRVDEGEKRYERLAERHIAVLEGSLLANTKALIDSNEQAEDRFEHIMSQLNTVLDVLKGRQT